MVSLVSRIFSVTKTHAMLIFEHLRLAAVAPFLLLPLLPVTASPLSSCYGNSTTLDWYIDAVGETPCTFELC